MISFMGERRGVFWDNVHTDRRLCLIWGGKKINEKETRSMEKIWRIQNVRKNKVKE